MFFIRIYNLLVRIRILPSASEKIKKRLDFYCCDFVVNLPSKRNKHKKIFFVGVLKVIDEKSRIRIS
jgi:hypothetical protein